jgi:aspartate kinase
MITTSEIKISVLVDRASAVPALRAVHQAFQLDHAIADASPFVPSRSESVMNLVPLADANGGSAESRILGMEDLVIEGAELDESQARITVFHVPDRPGYAAKVFRSIGDAGVLVDMIVQNVGIAGDSVLSFTVPKEAASRAVEAAKAAGARDVSVEPAMAKLSVIGVGMRTHTGVATRMFAALAERGINVNLINTSEVRINVGTDIARGREGLECLRRAFAL